MTTTASPAPPTPRATAPIPVVLAGCGGYGEFYLTELLPAHATGKAHLIAAVEPAPERCAARAELERLQIPLYPDLDSCLRRHRPELAVLAVPIHLHAPLSCLALAHGAHVLCEKPLCATLDEAARMQAARLASGRFLDIGYQWSHAPAILALRRDIAAGRWGRPRRLKTIALGARTELYYQRNRWAGRIHTADGQPVYDSPLNNAMAHYFHNMFFVLDDLPRTLAFETYRANPIENFDTAAVRVTTARGTELLFYTSHAVADRWLVRFEFEFDDAVITFSTRDLIRATTATGHVHEYGNPDDAPANKLWHALAAAGGDGAVPCPVEAAWAHTACVHALQSAAATVPFSPVWVEPTQTSGGRLQKVRGLSEALQHCFEAGTLPSETGQHPWSAPARTVTCQAPV